MVGGHGTDFADTHNFVSGNAYWIAEPIDIPELK